MSLKSNNWSHNLFYILLLISFLTINTTQAAGATDTYALTGIVKDGETGEGLIGAHVFLLESTVGTVTGEEGMFSLAGLPAGEYKVGVSMIGFRPYSMQVNVVTETKKFFEITLTPQVYELDQLTVTGKQSKRWRKQLREFTLHVIGDSENAQETEIMNPEVLSFIQRRDILIAEAQAPLVIENNALGYRIYYTLVHCTIQHGRPQYKGIARFEELTPKNKRQSRRWKKNREQAYNGSFKHLLRTLATVQDIKEIEREGFAITHANEFPETIRSYDRAIQRSKASIHDFVQKIPSTNENLLQVKDYLLITFSKELESNRYVQNYLMHNGNPDIQRSSIELRKDSTVFNDSGFLHDAYSVVLHGYMGWERMAELLPLDYAHMDGLEMRASIAEEDFKGQ
ncbi:MAG: carboxypeptidase-like regulatory domain-containing protein [Rhodothermales bacterium]